MSARTHTLVCITKPRLLVHGWPESCPRSTSLLMPRHGEALIQPSSRRVTHWPLTSQIYTSWTCTCWIRPWRCGATKMGECVVECACSSPVCVCAPFPHAGPLLIVLCLRTGDVHCPGMGVVYGSKRVLNGSVPWSCHFASQPWSRVFAACRRQCSRRSRLSFPTLTSTSAETSPIYGVCDHAGKSSPFVLNN